MVLRTIRQFSLPARRSTESTIQRCAAAVARLAIAVVLASSVLVPLGVTLLLAASFLSELY